MDYPDGNCATVNGKLSYRRQRVTNFNGNNFISYTGHRGYYVIANCSGNGDVIMEIKRNGLTKVSHGVPVGSGFRYYYGKDLPSTRVTESNMRVGISNRESGPKAT